MKSQFSLFLLLVLALIFSAAKSQSSISDSVLNATLMTVHYAYHFPAGDLDDRFGSNSAMGFEITFKMKKNWLMGPGAGFLFGNKVKEDDILDKITTPEGFLITNSGKLSEFQLQERGFSLDWQVGKIIPVFGPNPNSGLRISAGFGFIQHKIRIETEFEDARQLTNDAKKGYDRLTNGGMLKQFIGYSHLAENKLLNFYIGFEAIQAFTQNRRDWDFSTNSKLDAKRTDIFYGLKLGWMIPAYRQATEKFYYY